MLRFKQYCFSTRENQVKRSGIVAVAALGISSVLLVVSAGSVIAADATPTPSSSSSAAPAPKVSEHPSSTASPNGQKDPQARLALKAQRQAINATARAAVEKARADFRTVLASKPTPEARAAAVTARKAAIASAKAARIAAMQALIPGWTPHSHVHS